MTAESLLESTRNTSKNNSDQIKLSQLNEKFAIQEDWLWIHERFPEFKIDFFHKRAIEQTRLPPQFFNNPNLRNDIGWTLSANLEVFDFNKTLKRDIRSANRKVRSQQLALQYDDVAGQIHALLGRILTAKYKLMLNKNHLTVSKKLNELTTRTYKIGGKSKIEWLQSKANLLSLEQQAEEIEIEIKDGLVKLSQVAGTTDAQADVVTYLETATLEGLETDLNRIYKINSITPLLIERLGNGDRDDFISKLRGSSPVFKLYDLETTAASVQSQQHLATHLPSITIKGDVTKRGYQWGDVLNRHNNARNIGVYLSIPLFSGGSLFAHHRIETTQELINQQNKTISYKQLEDKLYSSFSTILQNYKILQLKSKYLLEKEEIVKLKEFSYSKGNILYEDLALEITDYWRELLEYRKSMSVTGETIIDLCAKAGLSNLLQ